MEKIIEQIKDYIERLNKASKSYYNEGLEIMSNLEYDALYDKLKKAEEKYGIILSGSPTRKVGYEVSEKLPKEEHLKPMLSLDKTKDRENLKSWLGDKEGVLSWKLDGLTIVLTYEEGKLKKAVTRGNGTVGEVVTNNARTFINLPLEIPYKGHLVLRGEAVISYRDFENINEEIPEVESKYKNPRNLCSGSVRQLNNQVTAERRVRFLAFSLVEAKEIYGEKIIEVDFHNSFFDQLSWLSKQGFEVVEHIKVRGSNLEKVVDDFEKNIKENPLPSDGLVLVLDDLKYSESLGSTVKFPRYAIAFKWQDEVKKTVLKNIIWNPSRTGLINPIGEFEPVELEGTKVSKASLHNVSVIRELALGIGDEIEVYKANMIIPQILKDLDKSNNIELPKLCPACKNPLTLKNDEGIETLHCQNRSCPAKELQSFVLFVSKNGLNIEGMSEKILERFIDLGFIKEFSDIYRLDRYKKEIISLEGFGEKSYINLQDSIEKSKKVKRENLLCSLGISGIGIATSKVIIRTYNLDWESIEKLTKEELLEVEGIGEVISRDFVNYFHNEENLEKVNMLIQYLDIEESNSDKKDSLKNLTFVITGKLKDFKKRSDLVELIEENGGRVTSSVTKNTDYLINNEVNSNSSKNKKAKELGVKIISESDFEKLL